MGSSDYVATLGPTADLQLSCLSVSQSCTMPWLSRPVPQFSICTIREGQDLSTNEFKSADYRRALGCFATGVAVVTSLDERGEKIGITINSFNSVSLDPPLVLWSVAKDSLSYRAFVTSEYFAVNVLATHQRDVCERFANSGTRKFNGLSCDVGIAGIPLLPDYTAVFECQTANRYDGGDHTIVVGEVLKFEDRKTDPLIFYRGHYLK